MSETFWYVSVAVLVAIQGIQAYCFLLAEEKRERVHKENVDEVAHRFYGHLAELKDMIESFLRETEERREAALRQQKLKEMHAEGIRPTTLEVFQRPKTKARFTQEVQI